MRIVSENQLTLELQPSLLQRFSTLRQCVHHTALTYPKGMKQLAADLDLSESELSRRLNPSEDDKRSCDVNLMVRIVEITGDLAPLHWFMARFLHDAELHKQQAMNALVQMAPQMLALFVEAGLVPPHKTVRK